jgi:restriction system protein
MAKKTSPMDDFILLASKLPWWLSLLFAVGSGLYLHSLASAPLPVLVDIHQLDSAVTHSALKGIAVFAQFLLPLAFVGGAIVSIVGRRKRQRLLRSASTPSGRSLAGISWHEFELLVGEALRRQGFSIEESGGAGPDGGIDLIAHKDGERYLVQCKHWRALQVGVPVVRELYGAMAAEGAVGGFVVTSGGFTQPAREFAKGRNLQLIDGPLLKRWIAAAQPAAPIAKPSPSPTIELRVEPTVAAPKPVHTPPPTASPPAPQTQTPTCPFCKKPMVTKTARTGRNAGGNFWGCTSYPKCRGIRPIFAGIDHLKSQ